MRALVTGGAGFIGSTLVDRLLAEGHAVDVVDDLSTGRLENLAEARGDRRHQLAIHHVDIRQPEVVDLIVRRSPEVVFHLAARGGADVVSDAEVTVLGTLRVLEGARRAGAGKVVFASTAAVYGEVDAKKLPARESQPQHPVTAHAVAKKAATDYLSVYRADDGVEYTALALGSVYGPRRSDGAVFAFARAALDGVAPTVHGDGGQTRDLLYVDDAVDAFVRAADRANGLLVNIGTGQETSVLDLVRTVADLAGVAIGDVRHDAAVAGVHRSAVDAGRAKIHLGWEPWTSLEEGVAETLRWLRGR